MNTTKQIIIFTREVKANNQKFYVSETNINGTYYKVKFTRACVGSPQKAGTFYLTLNTAECHVQKGLPYTRKDGKQATDKDTIWVHRIVELREETAEEKAEKNAKRMSEIFGDENETGNMPF